jgi:hypothetical protein
MSDPVQRFLRAKETVESIRRTNDRTRGLIDGIKGRLAKYHSCRGLKDGEKKLASLEAELKAKVKDFEAKIERFEKKHGEKLG